MAAELAVPPPSKTATPGDPPAKTSLYVGDLDTQVTERDLVEMFHYFGPLASVRLCRDSSSGKSLCYGYVNFFSNSHASKALDIMNHAEVKGKPMRIMWSQRNPLPRKTGIGNLFVKNLDHSITSRLLESIFCKFGTILSCKVAEENGKSKGFGFVQFDSEECAMAARGALHDTVVKGKKLYVSKFVKKTKRTTTHEEPTFTNLYVKNLAEDVTEDLLRDKFSRFGKVCSLAIMKNDKGRSKGFGFVNFELPEEAKKAVEVLNGSLLGSNLLFVGRAQKKAEREELLKHEHERNFNCSIQKFKASNLYVKNLDISVDESKLKKYFSVCGGKIVSVRVMRDQNGISRRFGFVCFSTPEEATKAIDSLNGTILEGRHLFVAFAQSKEERHRGLLNNPICPVHYNFTPYSSLYPLVHWPMMSQHAGTNAGLQYPLQYPFVQNYPYHHLSTRDPRRQTRQSDTENQFFHQNSRNSAYYYGFTPYVNYGNHPTGSRNFVQPHSNNPETSWSCSIKDDRLSVNTNSLKSSAAQINGGKF